MRIGQLCAKSRQTGKRLEQVQSYVGDQPRYFPFCSVSRVLIFISGGNSHPRCHDFNRKAGTSGFALNLSLIFIRSSSVNMAKLNRKQGK